MARRSAARDNESVATPARRSDILDPSQRAAWTGLFQLTQRLVARVDAAFRDRFELSVADAELLFLLSLSEVPPRVVELSNRVLMSQSSVSRALAALDERGLVARTSSEQDGRATHVMLTPDGRALVRELRRLEESVLDQQLFAYLDDAAVESLLEVWHRLPWLTIDVAQVGEWTIDQDRGKDVAPRRRPRRPLVAGD